MTGGGNMKRFLIIAVACIVASSGFASGPQVVGSSHAESGYDYKDLAVSVLIRAGQQGMMWLNANSSYPLLFSERDKLAKLVEIAAKKIDIANSNKTTISYVQEIGRFYSENGGLFVVSFDTDGYGLSYAVVRVAGDGNSDILMLNKKDTEDFINVLENANNLVDDYQRQVALFK
jgi:hypothetical protein